VAQAEFVHIHGCGGPGAALFAKAARRQGKPYVLAPLGAFSTSSPTRRSLTQRLFGARSDKAMLRSAARVHALNKLEAAELAGLVPADRIEILPYGVDCALEDGRTSIPTATGEPHDSLLMLGAIEPTEGAAIVLKAIAEVGPVADGWHVVIAGPIHGKYRAMLEASINRKGGEGRVRFASGSDTGEQRDRLAGASLLVAAGLRIRPPVSIMLAVSAGVPVLATDCLAPDELVEHLFVCRPGRAELRTRLREVLELDRKKRSERATGAIECLRARLDWRVLAERYADCYRKVLQTAHR
jgi:glycosyltransferase involved in cell wall biosynthesis